ncbi:cytochrome-c peroxidase [Nannocystis pusilla]|uniref:cytochrome-c peroxidase n=1 Tax=Nannocystis pusilla TaxID=889268 RepID=UPI003B76A5CB
MAERADAAARRQEQGMQTMIVAASTFLASLLSMDVGQAAESAGSGLTAVELLGKRLFFDESLSIGRNQSCAVCHGRDVGWTGPVEEIDVHGAVYEGSVPGRFGPRKPPSSAYAPFSPPLHRTPEGEFVGGNFWDGRATGEELGTPAADQAQGPFLNPVEQALPDAAAVVARACSLESEYWLLLRFVWGIVVCDDVDAAFAAIARSIARYEASREMSPFSSKFDLYLAGEVALTDQERRGLSLFKGEAKCNSCHAIAGPDDGGPPLFTDFTFANIGAPRNPENPYYTQPPAINPLGEAYVDLGLGGFLAARPEYAEYAAANEGKHRVPTLRNVDRRPWPSFTKAYGHNGYFKSLEEMVHFYNTRDVLPPCGANDPGEKITCWPASEVPRNLDADVGDLGLTPAQEADIVAFLRTLTDR